METQKLDGDDASTFSSSDVLAVSFRPGGPYRGANAICPSVHFAPRSLLQVSATSTTGSPGIGATGASHVGGPPHHGLPSDGTGSATTAGAVVDLDPTLPLPDFAADAWSPTLFFPPGPQPTGSQPATPKLLAPAALADTQQQQTWFDATDEAPETFLASLRTAVPVATCSGAERGQPSPAAPPAAPRTKVTTAAGVTRAVPPSTRVATTPSAPRCTEETADTDAAGARVVLFARGSNGSHVSATARSGNASEELTPMLEGRPTVEATAVVVAASRTLTPPRDLTLRCSVPTTVDEERGGSSAKRRLTATLRETGSRDRRGQEPSYESATEDEDGSVRGTALLATLDGGCPGETSPLLPPPRTFVDTTRRCDEASPVESAPLLGESDCSDDHAAAVPVAVAPEVAVGVPPHPPRDPARRLGLAAWGSPERPKATAVIAATLRVTQSTQRTDSDDDDDLAPPPRLLGNSSPRKRPRSPSTDNKSEQTTETKGYISDANAAAGPARQQQDTLAKSDTNRTTCDDAVEEAEEDCLLPPRPSNATAACTAAPSKSSKNTLLPEPVAAVTAPLPLDPSPLMAAPAGVGTAGSASASSDKGVAAVASATTALVPEPLSTQALLRVVSQVLKGPDAAFANAEDVELTIAPRAAGGSSSLGAEQLRPAPVAVSVASPSAKFPAAAAAPLVVVPRLSRGGSGSQTNRALEPPPPLPPQHPPAAAAPAIPAKTPPPPEEVIDADNVDDDADERDVAAAPAAKRARRDALKSKKHEKKTSALSIANPSKGSVASPPQSTGGAPTQPEKFEIGDTVRVRWNGHWCEAVVSSLADYERLRLIQVRWPGEKPTFDLTKASAVQHWPRRPAGDASSAVFATAAAAGGTAATAGAGSTAFTSLDLRASRHSAGGEGSAVTSGAPRRTSGALADAVASIGDAAVAARATVLGVSTRASTRAAAAAAAAAVQSSSTAQVRPVSGSATKPSAPTAQTGPHPARRLLMLDESQQLDPAQMLLPPVPPFVAGSSGAASPVPGEKRGRCLLDDGMITSEMPAPRRTHAESNPQNNATSTAARATKPWLQGVTIVATRLTVPDPTALESLGARVVRSHDTLWTLLQDARQQQQQSSGGHTLEERDNRGFATFPPSIVAVASNDCLVGCSPASATSYGSSGESNDSCTRDSKGVRLLLREELPILVARAAGVAVIRVAWIRAVVGAWPPAPVDPTPFLIAPPVAWGLNTAERAAPSAWNAPLQWTPDSSGRALRGVRIVSTGTDAALFLVARAAGALVMTVAEWRAGVEKRDAAARHAAGWGDGSPDFLLTPVGRGNVLTSDALRDVTSIDESWVARVAWGIDAPPFLSRRGSAVVSAAATGTEAPRTTVRKADETTADAGRASLQQLPSTPTRPTARPGLDSSAPTSHRLAASIAPGGPADKTEGAPVAPIAAAAPDTPMPVRLRVTLGLPAARSREASYASREPTSTRLPFGRRVGSQRSLFRSAHGFQGPLLQQGSATTGNGALGVVAATDARSSVSVPPGMQLVDEIHDPNAGVTIAVDDWFYASTQPPDSAPNGNGAGEGDNRDWRVAVVLGLFVRRGASVGAGDDETVAVDDSSARHEMLAHVRFCVVASLRLVGDRRMPNLCISNEEALLPLSALRLDVQLQVFTEHQLHHVYVLKDDAPSSSGANE